MEQKLFDRELCRQFIEKDFQQSILPNFCQYIKFPNCSRQYDAEWNKSGLNQLVSEHIKKWILGYGLQNLKIEIIHDQGYTPLIFVQIDGGIQQTVLFYGHYDKQPPFSGWWPGYGATIPVISNGKLYGRGTVDDGYSFYGSLLAIKALQIQKIKFPRCLVIIQGDEESGSVHLFYYLEKLKQRIGNPRIIFCLDSGCINYQTFWLTKSLRGHLATILSVQNLEDGIHSGQSSGIVPSSFRIIRNLLDRIENPKTGQVNQIFQTKIPDNRYEQISKLVQKYGKSLIQQKFPLLKGCQLVSNNPLQILINKGFKAQLAITGASGFPQAEKAGNVLLPKISLKVSLRFPPTLDGNKVRQDFYKLLLQNPPYGAKVKIDATRCASGWNCPEMSQYLEKSIKEASNFFYGKDPLCISEGVSIPFMGKLTELWPKSQFIITGARGPFSNAHGPNECLQIDYTKKLIGCMALILSNISANYKKS